MLAHFRAKHSTGRSPILCLVFFGPFSFPNSPFNSQLHPFRTLKVQWWHMSSAAGVGSRSASHTHYRLFDFRAKTEQDARPFLFWRFGGSANDRSVQLEPQICLKTVQDPGQFVFWRLGGCVSDRMCTARPRNVWNTTHDARQCLGGVFWRFLVSKCTFQGSKSINFAP